MENSKFKFLSNKDMNNLLQGYKDDSLDLAKSIFDTILVNYVTSTIREGFLTLAFTHPGRVLSRTEEEGSSETEVIKDLIISGRTLLKTIDFKDVGTIIASDLSMAFTSLEHLEKQFIDFLCTRELIAPTLKKLYELVTKD